MKFIKLTEVRSVVNGQIKEERECFLNISNVACIRSISSNFANSLIDITGSISVWVKETPEEIMEMIKEEK